ncbi:hypothetical protein POM88_020079 [Heracleum sosnowskyi]|uniref:Uncharacterized protein n=1 Tax=Heracleum sosnowskyi TaxID=360622 RepID=A0AAD8IAW0_9APIA|nr:hypothetical protein POM88_020079 [Heracleum sosnowskyi]
MASSKLHLIKLCYIVVICQFVVHECAIEKKSIIPHKVDETMSNVVPKNNYNSVTSVATKTSNEVNKLCYPKVCIRSQTGTEVSFCWCCTGTDICAKTRQDCLTACKM